MSALETFPVPVVLYVEDDDADGARATVQTILESAGGSDLAERPDGTTFGFAVEPADVGESGPRGGERVLALTVRDGNARDAYDMAERVRQIADELGQGYNAGDGWTLDVIETDDESASC